MLKKMFSSVYTRTGDKGTSGLYKYGKRFPKDHPVYDALGTIDELSSHLGHANVENDIDLPLTKIQITLQDINSHLADPSGSSLYQSRDQLVSELEAWIDRGWDEMPPLKSFIYHRVVNWQRDCILRVPCVVGVSAA
jgi:cob(I)alamin adenosyltransferase